MRIFASLFSLVVIAALCVGCAGTRAAYQAAQSPEDYAYVVTEHYAAVVHEAAALKASGKLAGSALTKVQALDNQLNPLVLQLQSAAELYSQTKSAKDSVALQAAVDKVVPLLADLLKQLKKAGSTADLYKFQHGRLRPVAQFA